MVRPAEIFRRYERGWLVLLALAAFAVTFTAPQFLPRGDAAGALTTAQEIINKGTIRIDPFVNELTFSGRLHYSVIELGGHFYYFYPPRTPLLTTPIVEIANLFGVYMPKDDALLQKVLLAWSVALISLLLYHLGRCHLIGFTSYPFAIEFSFGSAVAGTMGTALWAQNLTTILVLGLFEHLVRFETRKRASLNPYMVGIILIGAVLCRPTGLLFIPGVRHTFSPGPGAKLSL